ncbi:serine hydrolase domain-containing protein [Bacteroidota bacterium]
MLKYFVKKIAFVLVLLVFFSVITSAQDNISKKIADYVEPYVESKNFGGGILVVKDGKTIFEKYYGMANYELGVPVTAETKFNIASVSKSFTAASILLLQERGKLDVTDRVSKFLSDYPNGDSITIHHLLIHSTGIPRIIFFPEYHELNKQYYTTAEVVDLFKDKPLAFQPGERSSYSNPNYILLAYLVEKISEMSFSEFLYKNIFNPLDMSNTALNIGNNDLILNRADGYEVVGFNEYENTEYANPSILVGASSIYTTVTDLNKWMNGLLSGKILNSESLAQMFKTHSGSRGYGWMLPERSERKVYTLGGWSNNGFVSDLTHIPDENLTIIMLSNIEIITIKEEMESNIISILLEKDYTPFNLEVKPIDHELAEKLEGTYKFGDDFYNPGGTMTLVEKDGYLYEYQKISGRYIGMIQLNEFEFIHRSSWGRVIFRMDENGVVTGLQIYGYFEAEKLSGSTE